MLKLQELYHCHQCQPGNPTHFVPNILEALLIAAKDGLSIPLVYNCGGYGRRLFCVFLTDSRYLYA
jgi:putative pyruvate formate lyase activating enzyme